MTTTSKRLTDEKVEEIRNRYATGKFSVRQLAKEYSVSHMTVHRVVYDRQPQTPHDVYIERFWSYVNVRGEEDCWQWTGGISGNGYGSFSYRKRSLRAHKFAYETTHSVCVPSHLHVCHSCDNPTCCNPKHLSVGTPKQNIQEKVMRKRAYRGGRKPKLDELQVLQVKFLSDVGVQQYRIARFVGVSGSAVSNYLQKNALELQRRWVELQTAGKEDVR